MLHANIDRKLAEPITAVTPEQQAQMQGDALKVAFGHDFITECEDIPKDMAALLDKV